MAEVRQARVINNFIRPESVSSGEDSSLYGSKNGDINGEDRGEDQYLVRGRENPLSEIEEPIGSAEYNFDNPILQ